MSSKEIYEIYTSFSKMSRYKLMHTVLLSTYRGKENEYITSNIMDELNKTIN